MIVFSRAVIGSSCKVNCQLFIENDVVNGDGVTIKSGVQIRDGISLEDGGFVGPSVTFINAPISRSKQRPDTFSETTVHEGASIDADTTILPGVEIGRFAMIGASAVVTRGSAARPWPGNSVRHRGFVTAGKGTLDLDVYDENGNEYQLVDQEPILV